MHHLPDADGALAMSCSQRVRVLLSIASLTLMILSGRACVGEYGYNRIKEIEKDSITY